MCQTSAIHINFMSMHKKIIQGKKEGKGSIVLMLVFCNLYDKKN